MRLPSGERGATLVLNLLAMASFALLAVAVYASSDALARGTGYDTRSTEALAIAEAGLEDAMQTLYRNAEWRTGFSSKTFGNGFYNVWLTTDTPPAITSTGFSRSVPLYGRAVRTVSARTIFTEGACPYALLADDIEIEGKVDAYDVTSTLTPCATCFISGANIWANDRLEMAGTVPCTSSSTARMRGEATLGGSNALQTSGAGSAACFENGLVLSTASIPLPNWTGGSSTHLNVPNNSTTTLTAGTYNYNKVDVNGTLILDTSTGTIYINFQGNFKADGANCAIRNTSKIPSRVHIADASGNSGHTIVVGCKEPLHAYLEGNANRFEIAQEVYGHYCGGSVFISSDTSGIGRVHYDIGGGLVSKVSLRTDNTGWTQSYKRQ
jgi:hypothetical protein